MGPFLGRMARNGRAQVSVACGRGAPQPHPDTCPAYQERFLYRVRGRSCPDLATSTLHVGIAP